MMLAWDSGPLGDARANRQSGFTLIELLVVIAIIGVLVGLLLPAVQQAREAARRTSCVNNMKQLGVAIHNFIDANKRLPAGGDWTHGRTVTGSSWPTPNRDLGSLFVKLLPFVEQNTLYSKLKFDNPNTAVPNQLVDGRRLWSYSIAGFVCVSDTPDGIIPAGMDDATSNPPTVGRAISNYEPSFGPTGMSGSGNPACPCTVNYNAFRPTTTGQTWPFKLGNPWLYNQGSLAHRGNPAGPFTRDDADHFTCRLKDIPDGLSKTIAFGEVRMDSSQAVRNGWAYSGSHGVQTTIVPLNYDSFSDITAADAASALAQATARGLDGCAASYNWQTEQAFRSRHPGVVNFLMCDGSVLSISENCDHYALQRYGCRADGRPEGTL